MLPEEYSFHVVVRFVAAGHRHSVGSRIYENQEGYLSVFFPLQMIAPMFACKFLLLRPFDETHR